ncbi:non-ribosomal peptide synthetase [Pantoea agglomerans]|uniref:Dapdiamide synthesis protein DdaD n=1 Tax=Enterobacter agglomerans TaxID=549 RepID=A0AAN2K8M9_ENTAG|nr:non-ribosomal peptide synthetase [Pantoea agglomerans]CAH6384529.1 Dapdiamide synthesis protein DdaD [Pantoea agglomerans]
MHNVEAFNSPTLNSLLETTARRFGNRLAVQDDNVSLTFADFIEKVGTLAARLRLVLKRGEHVAVQLPRGINYIVAAYAIWEAGGVYLPLDNQWPSSRIEGILHRSHVRVLIHTSQADQGLELTELPAETRAESPVAGTPAYIIHTSGTTGEPKGVMVSHESLIHLVESHQRDIYQAHDVTEGPVAINASFCFDSALERMALVALGYSLHVVSDQVRKSPYELVKYLRDNSIVNVDLVPSHLKVLLSAGLNEKCDALRLVIVGGEAIDTELWREIVENQAIYINVYGPTENTINTSFCEIRGETPHIGRPFKNVTCLLLNENGERCAAGDEGELLVAGRHLAQGYYNAPDLTNRVFVHIDGIRYYRTGDRVRQNEQGDLLYLGRIDDQVKINGFRIELADVQHNLTQLPCVQYAAVTPIKQPAGQGLLASIVWNSDAAEQTFTNLEALLGEKLPSYMVPTRWQKLDALPLTDNLKLDHKLLLNHWKNSQEQTGKTFDVESISATEHQIKSLWQKILRQPSLSPDAHFFASGGDSMAAMTLLVELKKVTPQEVSLGDIFKYPTIRKMAAWLDASSVQAESK